MATGRTLETESYAAAADLSAKQFYIMTVTAEDAVNVCNASLAPCGVLQNKPESGEAASVMQLGISKVVSDGSGTAIAAGDPLKSNASGKAIKSDGTTGHIILGRATEPSTADGTIIGIDLTRGPYVV